MKTLSFYTTSLFIILWLPNCKAQEEIVPGIYQEFAGENIELPEQEEIILYPDSKQTFEYRFYTNENGGKKFGNGRYRQTSKKLILKFDQSFPPRSYAELLSTQNPEEKVDYHFKITSSGSGEIISGVNVSIFNEKDEEIAKAVSDQDGEVSIEISPESRPAYFKVHSQVYDPLQQEIATRNSQYLVTMAIKYTDIIPKGTVMKFEILDIRENSIELKREDEEKYFALK